MWDQFRIAYLAAREANRYYAKVMLVREELGLDHGRGQDTNSVTAILSIDMHAEGDAEERALRYRRCRRKLSEFWQPIDQCDVDNNAEKTQRMKPKIKKIAKPGLSEAFI